MFCLSFAGLFGKSRSRKHARRTPVTKRFTRPLAFLRLEHLEERRMLSTILGTAESFAVLAGSTATNTGTTTITGNLGVWPGSAITGFPPGIVNPPFTTHAGDAVALQAQDDLTKAYVGLAGMPANSVLTGVDLGGLTLTSGVYYFKTSAQLTGTLTLDAQGLNNAFWVFQIGSTLTTASNSVVEVINLGSNDGIDDGVFWQVGSSATLGTDTVFEGNILALASITLITSATIPNGRALARNDAVTMDTNVISIICPNGGPGYSGALEYDENGNVVPVAASVISGMKFNDLNGDGVKDPGEPGWPGWTVYVDYSGDSAFQSATEPSAVTAADGTYTLTDVLPGDWIVREVGQPGWTTSYPATGDNPVTLTLNESKSGGDFGNYERTSIHGYKFNDLNGNGLDDGDPRLDGWTIELVGTDGQHHSVSATTTTGPDGEYSFLNLAPGVYTVSQQGQTGWTQAGAVTITLTSGEEAVAWSGEATGTILPDQIEVVTAELALGSYERTSIHGYKFNDLNGNGLDDGLAAGERRLAGWTIVLQHNLVSTPTTTGPDGEYSFTDLTPGVYVVSEQGQTGWTRTVGGTTITLTSGQEAVAYHDEAAGTILPDQIEMVTDGLAFGNHKYRVIVIAMGKSPLMPQYVTVMNEETGDVLSQFAPYGNKFRGGVRVATGDLNGDGVDEIVTAPGWGIVAEVHVYSQTGVLLDSFRPYGPKFMSGVNVAVGDVDGNGLNDIITVPSWGNAEVKVFRYLLVGGVPTLNVSAYRDFLAFPPSFIGGAVVAVADMGTQTPNGAFDTTDLDLKAEIVVGSGAGIKTTVKVFDVSGMPTPTPTFKPRVMATAAGSFAPFSIPNYRGGVSLSVAKINADDIPDIVVGAGAAGRSLVDVWAWNYSPSATLHSLSNSVGFAAFGGASRNSPVEVAALDTDGDGFADAILAAQGPGGTTRQIIAFNISVSPLLHVTSSTPVPGDFLGPYIVATIKNPSPLLPLLPKKVSPIKPQVVDRFFAEYYVK